MQIKHCNDWWYSLTDTQKRYIHYVYWDIKKLTTPVIEKGQGSLPRPFGINDMVDIIEKLDDKTIQEQHDFRFTIEHPDDEYRRANRTNIRKD